MDYTIKEIEKNAPETIANQITGLVLLNVESGLLCAGDKLPAERDMAKQLNVARGTVKAAYKQLQQMGVIESRQGSGSYVSEEKALPRQSLESRAMAVLSHTVDNLREMGMSDRDLRRLLERCIVTGRSERQIHVAILSSAPELLLDLRRQLSEAANLLVSVFILDSVTENSAPETLLSVYDLIIVPSGQYVSAAGLLPGLHERIVQAAVTPGEECLVALAALKKDARVGIICRSNAFLATVKKQLLSLGFQENNILSFFESDYTTATYFPGGINILVSFDDAHIFQDPAFAFRNEEFQARGGVMIQFRQRIDNGTVIHLKERIQKLQSAHKKRGE